MKVTGWTNWVYQNETDLVVIPSFDDPEINDKYYDDAVAAVIDELRENNYKFSGDAHQNMDDCAPIIDDKYILCVSQRTWGWIMSMAYPDDNYSLCEEDSRYLKWAFVVWPEEIDNIKIPHQRNTDKEFLTELIIEQNEQK